MLIPICIDLSMKKHGITQTLVCLAVGPEVPVSSVYGCEFYGAQPLISMTPQVLAGHDSGCGAVQGSHGAREPWSLVPQASV
jgi:hypothetical protein